MTNVHKEHHTRNRQLKHLGFRSYRDYLQSEHWQRTRKWFKYSGYVERTPTNDGTNGELLCSQCHQPRKPLHVHHKTYKNLGYEVLSDLQLLCKECHSALHQTSG